VEKGKNLDEFTKVIVPFQNIKSFTSPRESAGDKEETHASSAIRNYLSRGAKDAFGIY
jgi:hypothetical protein